MIDLHCHLDLYPNPVEVVRRCRSERIFVLSVTTTPSAYRGTVALALDDDRIQTALGLHPQLAVERRGELALFDELVHRVRWVGEIGLDGASASRDSWRTQREVFRHILRSCENAGGRVLSIHSRRAAAQVLAELREFPDAGLPVLHWFSGSLDELKQAIEIGCWFSVGLPMLQSKRGRRLVASLPSNRVLTETDGPFVRIDVRPAYPWDTEATERELASLWNRPGEQTSTVLAENLSQLITAAVVDDTTHNPRGTALRPRTEADPAM